MLLERIPGNRKFIKYNDKSKSGYAGDNAYQASLRRVYCQNKYNRPAKNFGRGEPEAGNISRQISAGLIKW